MIGEAEDSRLAPLGNQAISRAWSTVLNCFENHDYLNALTAMRVWSYTCPDEKIGNEYDKWLKTLSMETAYVRDQILNTPNPLSKLPYQRELQAKHEASALLFYKQLIQRMKPYLDYQRVRPQNPKGGHFE